MSDPDTGGGIVATFVPADDQAFKAAFVEAVKESVAFVADSENDDAKQIVLDALEERGYPSVAIEAKRPLTIAEFVHPKDHVVVYRDGAPA